MQSDLRTQLITTKLYFWPRYQCFPREPEAEVSGSHLHLCIYNPYLEGTQEMALATCLVTGASCCLPQFSTQYQLSLLILSAHSAHSCTAEFMVSLSCLYKYNGLFSGSVMPNSLGPYELQYARLPCPSLSPGVWPDSCPLSQ